MFAIKSAYPDVIKRVCRQENIGKKQGHGIMLLGKS